MLNVFPAQPETTVIDANGNNVAHIIGWVLIQGAMAHPVFAVNRSGIAATEAIWHADGTVTHPHSQKFFEDADRWVAFIETETDVAETVTGEKPTGTTEGTAPDTSPLVFGNKSNKTKSFWHWPVANAIFEIEGDAALPNDPRAVKVKREEFAELKRNGAVKIDPHAGIIEDDAPEAPVEDDDMECV